ncbi:Growth-regulating factor 1, putative isoform 2 [Hibiscus syriacus]|uniref:Growth-regulating factor n=1 Tax=Hibiscus syriacus TaxID=106335 RepID=A0A6A3AVA5_HIBSY|nr:Growth-regulating factor 1, putative isoform 2 [Hibiscus syriacus]
MDFGVLGLDGIVGPHNGAPSPSPTQTFLSAESKPMLLGSRFTKQERSSDSAEEDHWKSFKLPRTDDLSTSKTMSLHQGTPLLISNSLVFTEACQQDHMINLSLLKSEVHCTGKEGYGSGSLNAGLHEFFIGVEGPFTLFQWNELKSQALIYKYITSNVPVPSNLLIPLKKSLYPYGFTSSSAGSLPYNSLGWGSFHLRYTGNTDPERGRCRRTDGKKWRCSRDAVADQKYCERHINRGRRRSRKPVEDQISHAATGTTNSKGVPMPSSSVSASVKTSGGTANSLAIAWQHQFKNLQLGAANPYPGTLANRIQDQRVLPVLSSTTNLKYKESTFMITKQGVPFAESFPTYFGHVASDSLINPSHKSSYMNSKEFGLLLDFTGQENQNHTPPHQFIDGWPKNHSSINWPDELKSDRTQLSMSIPMATSEFSSSSSSPEKEKLDLSSLRLSREFDSIQMGLEMNIDLTETDHTKKQANRVPMSWGSSMGGPLGEALNNTTNNVDTLTQL